MIHHVPEEVLTALAGAKLVAGEHTAQLFADALLGKGR
jgi:hypothetical protein